MKLVVTHITKDDIIVPHKSFKVKGLSGFYKRLSHMHQTIAYRSEWKTQGYAQRAFHMFANGIAPARKLFLQIFLGRSFADIDQKRKFRLCQQYAVNTAIS